MSGGLWAYLAVDFLFDMQSGPLDVHALLAPLGQVRYHSRT